MIVIAPRYMHLDIINYYRKDNPFFDVKVVDKNDLVGAVGYLVKQDTILYMMLHYGYSYDEAQTYLSFLKTEFVPSSLKLNKLKALQVELIEANYLYKSEVSRLLFEHKSALVIGYSELDNELLYLSNLLDMKLDFFKYGDSYNVNSINYFSRLEDEVYYVLNEIAHDIDSGMNINDIYILNRNEEYIYYLKTFSPLFGFNINFPNNYAFIKTGVYSEFKRIYEETQNVDEALTKLEEVCLNDDIYHQFVEAVNKIKVDDLPYEIESVYLDKKLASMCVEEPRYLDAVNLINDVSLLINKKVYVLGFIQSQFPKSKKDDSYLDELELKSVNKLTNKLETKIDQENILNFFKLDNEFVLSYADKSLQSSKMYVSPLLEDLELKKIENPFENYFYSKDVIRYIACHLKDLNSLYGEDSSKYQGTKSLIESSYLKYDNTYKGAKVFNKNSHLRLSTSQLSDYAGCPFKYYMGRVLNVDPFEETKESIFGNIVHKILEESLLDDEYDVGAHYDELVNASNVDIETKVLWSLSLKEQIINMVRYVKLHNRYMANPRFEVEKSIDVDLNQYTSLTGKIDKMVILKNKYLVMIDYKTGSSGDFDEKYLKDGLSSQLPTYALLAKSSKYSKYTVTGLYINHVYTNKVIELKEDELIPSYLKLAGRSLDNYKSFFAFDSTISGKKSSFVKSVTSKEGVLTSRGLALATQEKLDEYIEVVKQKYLEVSELIRANKFDIYPADKGGENTRACSYCSYRDICFIRQSQIHHLVSEEETADE